MFQTLNKYFGIERSGSSLRTELRAALTTFLAMAYILFVNPQILSRAFSTLAADTNPQAQLLTATALAAAFGSILMGFLARYPIAVAPGMGLNIYFVYSVVVGRGLSWQVALGCVFVSGIVFLILSLSGLRETVVNAIPLSIKRATAAGIGLFIAFIGFNSSGFIVAKQGTLVGMGDITTPSVLLMFGALVLATILLVRKVSGALLISIVAASIAAVILQLPVYNGQVFAGFEGGMVRMPVWPKDLFGAFDLAGALQPETIMIVFTFLFVAFFDTAGTLIGLADKAEISDPSGRIARANHVFTIDALATTVGSILGTSTTTAYVESVAGIEEGGKTGLVAVVVGLLFLVSLFLWPLAFMVPAAATAPALIILGAMMMGSASKIEWNDYEQAIPAFLTMITMPLTWSISNGIAIGIISMVLVQVIASKAKDVHPVMYVLAFILALKLWMIGG